MFEAKFLRNWYPCRQKKERKKKRNGFQSEQHIPDQVKSESYGTRPVVIYPTLAISGQNGHSTT